MAELVQNAIDAQARHVRITRLRERGVTALQIVDDGDGVIPELDRVEALTYIATHIGHSRKRNLHSFPAPMLAPALERLVEILTITERRLERG
jgi:hypothetical protein